MREFIRRLSGIPGTVLPFAWIKLPARNYSIFPFYHIVSDDAAPHVRNLYPICDVARFRKDIDFFLCNYRPLTFSQVVDYANGGVKKGEKPGFFLTFDDGLREMADVVAPILTEMGIEAAFFVNPAFTGNHSLFSRHKISLLIDSLSRQKDDDARIKAAVILKCRQRDVIKRILSSGEDQGALIDSLAEILHIDFNRFLAEKKPYLELSQLRGLQKSGFIIGSHSYDHPLFSGSDQFQMRDQVTKSMDWLSSNLSVKERAFAFPYTDDKVSLDFFQWMYENTKIKVSFGTAGLKREQFLKHLQRIPMERRGYHSARQILGEEYVYYAVRSIFAKNMITGR